MPGFFISILILLMMVSSGCNNPSGGSVIRRGNAPFLKPPDAFSFTQIRAANGNVLLKWRASRRAANYKVYMGTSSSAVTTLVSSCTGLITTCSLSGLNPNTLYYFSVTSSNDAGSRKISAVGRALSVSSFDITSSSIADGSITVSWSPSTNATRYSILYGYSPGAYSNVVSNVTSPYTMSGLLNGRAHYFKVLATNGSNGYIQSDSEGTETPIGPPPVPTGLSLAASPGRINVSWNLASGADSYKVFRGTTSGSLTQIATTTSGNYPDNTTVDGTIYYYSIVASNSLYDSMATTEASARSISNFNMTSVTTASNPNQLTVSWPGATGASTYNIRYGTNPSSLSSQVSGVTSPYTVPGLTGGATYYFRVVAVNSVGGGTTLNSTNQLSGVPIPPVAAPTGVSATATPGQISVSWNNVSGASSYEVLRSTTNGGPYTSLQSGILANSYIDSTVTNGSTYYYVVRSFNGLYSANSVQVAKKPIAPFSISSVTPASSSSLQISWSGAPGADAYDVRYGTVSGSYTATATGVTSPYTLPGLSANTTYYIVVRARNAVGTGGTSYQSAQSSALTKTVAPSGLTASKLPGEVVLDWGNTAGATSYNIYRGTTSGTHTSLATGVTVSNYTDSTVSDGTTYYYVVTATNGSESANSLEVAARTIAPFTVTGTSSPSPTSIEISWAATTGAATYDIRYGTSSGSYTTTLTNRTSPATITGLSAGTTYYIIVVAKNAVGSGASINSNQVSQGTPVGPPTGLVATVGNDQISLSWTAMNGASSYKVYRGTTSGTYSLLASGNVPTSYVDSTVTNGTTYYYVVKSYNGSDSADSTEVTGKPIAAYSLSSLTATSATSLEVSFPATAGGDIYDVRYGTASGNYTTTASGVTSPHAISGLAANTTYYVVGRARNTVGSGASRQTVEVSVKTPTTAPASLAATATPGQVNLTWGAVTGATTYKIYRGTVSGTYSELANNVTTNSYIDTTVTNGTSYYYVVKASNGTDSANSNEVSIQPISSHTISSTSATSTSVVVNWNAVTGASGYDILWGTATGSYSGSTLNVTSPHTISGLSANTNYFIVVRAKNSVGSGTTVNSTEVQRRTSPGAPAGLTATASPGQVGLNWTATSGATSYKVYRGTTSGSLTLLSSGVGSNAYLDSTVTNGTTYYYSVVANNGSDSPQSSEVSVQPISSFTLSSAVAASSTSIDLAWTSATGAATYDVRYGTSTGVYLGTVPGVTSPYTLTGLSANTRYFISIRASNAVGGGSNVQSNELNATTATAAPSSLTASSVTGQVDLSWTAAAGASTYRIYRGTASGSHTLLASGVSSTTYSDTTVSNGTQYYYTVRAYNGTESADSNETSALPIGPFSISATTAPTPTTIEVTWGTASGAATYDVGYGTTSGTYTFVTNVTSPYTISGLSGETTYYIMVRARNAVGLGGTSETSEVSQITPIGPPSGLTAAASPGNVSLNWNAVTGASSYKVYRGTSSGTYSEIATNVLTNSYSDATVSNGTSYYYVVSAYNGADSAYSNEAVIRSIASFSISVTVLSDSSVQVSWTNPAGGSTYDVKYGTASGTYTTTLSNQTSPVTVTGLSSGSEYFFVVDAKNSVGNGTTRSSAEVGATTAFGAPNGLAAAATPGSVSLTWNSVSGATSYKVLRGTASGTYTEIESNAGTNSYTDSTVSDGTTYFYVVRAFNGTDSANSNEASVRPISAFTFSSATVASASSLTLTWTAATGAASYDVRYGTSSGTYTGTATGVTSPYTLTGLSAGTRYYVSIRAKNAVGSGTNLDSSELNALTSPGAPSSLAVAATTGQMVLTWTAGGGSTTNYNVYRSTATGGPYSQIASAVSATNYTDSTITNGTQYYYIVRGNNGTESVDSNEATGQSIASFTISSTSAPTPNSIVVTWPTTAGATLYDVRYGTATGSYATTVSGVTSPYTISGLTGDTNYYIVVRARNTIGAGSSAQSPEVTQVTPLSAPTGLAATSTPGSVALSWNTVTGAASYKVYRGTTSGTYSLLQSGVASTSYTDNTVSNGTTYYYVVKAYNGADSADSNETTTLPMANFSIASTSSPTSSSVEVTWTGPTGAATYDIKYGTTTGTYSTTVPGVTSPYTISGLSAGTTYYVVVVANNTVGAGTSVTSSESSQLTALGAPTGLTASASPGQVGLNWTDQPAATSYKIYRGTTSGSLTLLDTDVTTNAYLDTTVTNGTTYYYTVVAYNGSDSAQSAEVAILPIESVTLSSVTAASSSTINVTWAAAAGAASYDVRYGTSPGVYLGTVTGVTSPYTLGSLSSGTTYYISIQAKNSVGSGTTVNSNEMNAKTGLGAPANVAATSTPGNVSVSWTAVSGATNYNVYRATSSGGPYTQIASAVAASPYNDNTVSNGTTYYYVLRTFNGIESDNSTEVATQPIADFTLSAAAVNSASSATVTWAGATGAATYDVRIGTVSGTYSATYTNVTSPYEITGLSAATLYYVVVRANNAVGVGSSHNSNEVSFTTATAAPSSLSAAAATGQIALSWTAASGASTYTVYRSTASGGPYTEVANSIAVTNYTDSTVSNGTQYFYVVRATNGTESANSNEATATTIGSFTISSTTAPSSTSITVTWGTTSGATDYDVRYGTSTGTYSVTASGVTSPHTLTGLTANTNYFIIVRARNSVGSGTSTSTPEVTQITPVAPPTNLVATGGTSEVNLSWTAASGATSYKVFRGTVSGSLSEIASGISGTTYTDATAVNGTTYFYALKSYNGADSALSSEVSSLPIASFSISSVTGTNSSTLTVAWSAVSGASTYDLKYGSVSGTYTTTLTNVTSPASITGLSTATTYYVQLVAKNSVGTGTSVNSSESSGTTNSPPVLSSISNQSTEAPNVINAPFTLTDSNDLVSCTGAMSGSSSNTTLVPNANITFSGTMPNCTATVTPAVGQTGTATITLTATDGKDAATSSFDVTFTPCTVASITWETHPTSISAGSLWGTAPVVSLRKADGTLCTTNTNPVSLTVSFDTSAQQDAEVTGVNPATPSGGYATFSGATMTRAGTGYKLAAAQGTVSSLDSNTFNVTALAASKVIWAVQPSTTNRTSNIIPAPTVRVADMYDNYVAQSGLSITVSLQDNTEGATLAGTLTRSTDATGAAVFSNLTLDVLGTYYLRATPASTYALVDSTTFEVIQLIPQNTMAVLEMLNGSLLHSSNGNTSYPGAGISFGTNNIDGTTSYTWKIVATNTDNQQATIRLRQGTNNISSISIPGNTTTPTLFSTSISNASITPDSEWTLGAFKGAGVIYSSKIVVQQANATRTQIYIPLTSMENSTLGTLQASTTSTTFTQPNAMNFPTYNWDSSKIARVDSILLYVTSSASGGSSCVALFNKTTNSQIGNEICNASAADSIVSTAILPGNMPATGELEVRMRNSAGGTANLNRAGLLVRLVSIEKMLAIQRIAPAVSALTASTNFVEQRASSYISNYGTGLVSEYVVCRARANTSGGASFNYRNHGTNASGTAGSSLISASTINFSSQSAFTTLEAGPVVTVNGNNQFLNYTHTSGSFALSHCLLETEVSY